MATTPRRTSDNIDDKLLSVLERLATTRKAWMQAVATNEGLTPMQIQILQLVADAPAADRKISALAREVQVRQPTVTDAVNALQSKGLIDRYADAVDARASVVELTAAGKRVVTRLPANPAGLRNRVKKAAPAAKAATTALLAELLEQLASDVEKARDAKR